jgi:DNA repair protein RadA/Sms
MVKKIAYSCQQCGAVHFKWSGKCADCGAWNSLIEEYEEGGGALNYSLITSTPDKKLKVKDKNSSTNQNRISLSPLDGKAQEFPRIATNINELDRVLGGGLVKASVVLIGGDPGIGKSTLLLQTANSLAQNNNRVIYISGEESVDQIRLRARRLEIKQSNIELASATNIADIINVTSQNNTPDQGNIIMIIDSIQTMYLDQLSSAPGTVSQVRAAAGELTIFAKKNNITLLIVSHVTKDGQIAGPKVLEHMVDTVLYFEGEKDLHFRILRSIKNRFGAANEIGIFEMNDVGLNEVTNPSELFLASYDRDTSGTSVFAAIEGTRPLLVEVQALISPSFMLTPRRAVVGWDLNRLAMMIAVLNNRFGLNLFDKEVYLNIVGGIKINETAADLAIVMALISASRDIAIPPSSFIIGEIGLTGEVRMVANLESRIKEAAKLGFKNCFFPKANEKNKNWLNIKNSAPNINFYGIHHVRDLAKFFNKNKS